MKTKLIVLLMVLPFLSSCEIVEYDDYIHEPTQEIRQALVWQQSTMKKVSKLTDEPVLLVPNLREFTSSYSVRSATLILCSDDKEQVVIVKAVLINDDTGHKAEKKLDEKVVIDKKGYNKKNPFSTWIYLFQEKDVNYSKEFENAQSLTLEVYYRFNKDSPEKKQTYKIRLKKVKDVAWPT